MITWFSRLLRLVPTRNISEELWSLPGVVVTMLFQGKFSDSATIEGYRIQCETGFQPTQIFFAM